FYVCICFLIIISLFLYLSLFLFNDTATTEIYTLSLHDALPIYIRSIIILSNSSFIIILICYVSVVVFTFISVGSSTIIVCRIRRDRKSTRLNSSHVSISYAVFCLKKKIKFI